MAWVFNPFTGTFDQTGAGGGGGITSLTANTTPTTGFTAGQYMFSDGSVLKAGTFGTGVSTALGNAVNAASGLITFATFAPASGKSLTLNNTLTLAGTDGTTMTFPSTSATLARTDAGNTFTGAQTFSVGTVNGTGLDISQTWTGTGTYTGLKYNVGTDSGPSNAASLLLDLQVGGASQFRVTKGGVLNLGSGTDGIQSGGGSVLINVGGTAYANFLATALRLTTPFGFSTSVFSAPDTILTRAAAATLQLGAADTSASATVTITIATPGVVTWSSHGLSTGTPVVFSTTGALPTGITAGTTYYVIVVDANSFQIATSYANATAVSPTAVTTSGSQSGTHTGTRGAVDQVFRVQSASGTSNFPGADFAIQGSRGTGTGAGGSIIFQVAPAGSNGTAQNAYINALTLFPVAGSVQFGIASGVGWGISQSSGTFTLGRPDGFGGINSGTEVISWASNNNPLAVRGELSIGTALSARDVILARDAANTLALRNGTNAQRFNVYNTYTSSTNYEAFKVDWITTANTCLIGTEKGSGGGTARALALQTDGTTRLTISSGGTVSVSTVTNFGIVVDGTSAATIDTGLGEFRTAVGSIATTGGATTRLETRQYSQTGLSGATVTISNAIPANTIVLGVTARVTSAITGATTFDIGDGTTQDLFGNDVAIALGTTTTLGSNTVASLPKIYTTDTNIVLTANGSNFTGGNIRVVVHLIRISTSTA